MSNRDYDFILTDLSKRVKSMEVLIDRMKVNPVKNDEEWDNATLMQEWEICPRTAANYRRNGLESFKRGGRIFYSHEQRSNFMKNTGRRSGNE